MTKVNINIGAIEQAAKEAFQDAALIAHREMITVISEPGAFPEFPDSDIIGSGNLKGEQQVPEITKDGTEATFKNNAGYSLYVALGYTLRDGKEQPGRNWMMLALNRMSFQGTFDKLLEARLK